MEMEWYEDIYEDQWAYTTEWDGWKQEVQNEGTGEVEVEPRKKRRKIWRNVSYSENDYNEDSTRRTDYEPGKFYICGICESSEVEEEREHGVIRFKKDVSDHFGRYHRVMEIPKNQQMRYISERSEVPVILSVCSLADSTATTSPQSKLCSSTTSAPVPMIENSPSSPPLSNEPSPQDRQKSSKSNPNTLRLNPLALKCHPYWGKRLKITEIERRINQNIKTAIPDSDIRSRLLQIANRSTSAVQAGVKPENSVYTWSDHKPDLEPIGELIRVCRMFKLNLPEYKYEPSSASNPTTFKVTCSISKKKIATASGPNKRLAKKIAAVNLLRKLQVYFRKKTKHLKSKLQERISNYNADKITNIHTENVSDREWCWSDDINFDDPNVFRF